MSVVHVVGGMPWFAPFYLAISGVCAWTSWRGFRLRRRGVVVDGEGVGPAEDGVRLWTLPWRDYGGFRPASLSPWERLSRPERGGYVVLDRLGQPSFSFYGPAGGSSSESTDAGLAALRRHLPEGVPDPTRPAPREPRIAVVIVALVVGVSGVALMRLGLANPLTPLMLWGAFGALVGMTALVVAGIESVRLVRWQRGWRPSPPLPEPEEGPTLAAHVARHARLPMPLQEGRRYRVVDRERRRRELRQKVAFSRSAWIGVFLAGQSLYGLIVEPRAWPLLVVSALWWSLVAAFGFASGRIEQALLAGVDDVLWVHEGRLVVVRPGADPFSLPLPDSQDRAALRRLSLIQATDVLRTPMGERYYLDRTRLYAPLRRPDRDRGVLRCDAP